MPRRAWCANETYSTTKIFGRIYYQLVIITEGQPGFHVYQESRDLEELRAMAEISNRSPAMTGQDGGLTADDVLDIVASSMRAAADTLPTHNPKRTR